MLEFLIIITLFSIYILNLGIIKNKENILATGVILLVIVIVFGWLLVGITLNINKSDYKTNVILKKTNTEFTIKDSLNNKYVFNKKFDFDNITDTTIFYINISKNLYGCRTQYKLFYKINDRAFTGETK